MRVTYEGKPCKRCGGVLRYRGGRHCVACELGQARAYRETHGDKIRAQKRAYYAAHRDEMRAYREQNRDKIAARSRTRYARLMEQGLCAKCGQQPRLSEWFCWDCLNKKQFGAIKRQAIERGIDECHPSLTTPDETPSTQLGRLSVLK